MLDTLNGIRPTRPIRVRRKVATVNINPLFKSNDLYIGNFFDQNTRFDGQQDNRMTCIIQNDHAIDYNASAGGKRLDCKIKEDNKFVRSYSCNLFNKLCFLY